MGFNSIPPQPADTSSKVEGGQTELLVSDDNVQEGIAMSLVELKKISFQLSLITDTHLNDCDIEAV